MSYVLSLEFIAKALRAEHEPRKDAGVGEIGVTGQLRNTVEFPCMAM